MEKSSHLHKELASNIRKLLGEGKLDAALEQFEDTFLKNEALKLDTRLERWKARRAKGTRRSEEELVEENQLIEALMSLVERLEKGEDVPQKKNGGLAQGKPEAFGGRDCFTGCGFYCPGGDF